MINFVIALLLFLPFYVAVLYKHTTVLTLVMNFIWCSACTSMMILCVYVANNLHALNGVYETRIIITMIGWAILDLYIGIKMVLTDSPRYKNTK